MKAFEDFFGSRPQVPQGLIPIVIEKSGNGERAWDIFSRLLKERIVYVSGPINGYSADIVIAQLLFLNSEQSNKDISMYINSPGGHVTAGLGMYDTMQFIEADVATYCIGQCASMGAVLLSGGAKDKRFSLPNSRIMIHQPSGGTYGTASDMELSIKEINRLKKILYEIMAKHCPNRTAEELDAACDRDNFMSPVEAKEFGLIDHVIETIKSGGDKTADK